MHKAIGICAMFAGVSLVIPSARAQNMRIEGHSFARTDEVVMTHLDLDLTVDFEHERLSGSVKLDIVNKEAVGRLFLDTHNLDIDRITLGIEETGTSFVLRDAVEGMEYLGQALIVDIQADTRVVTVYYHTTDGALGIDWLKPSQTAGGNAPFLYTQGQCILNRSWIPCQDTPGIRITYNARIHTPPGLMAVMSARNATERSADGLYEFTMPQPIPPYLIALAVGDIDYRRISERCGVYAEPSVVDDAAWEFADAEAMMQEAEALYGPYRWERYDVIVLPPSFPYGGMENPRLTFVTPVLITGDRSLVSTIAHELAHSWSGNLVTNATWDDFWLNEGFTTYIERRISEAVYGTEQTNMEALLGFGELQEVLENEGENSDATRLHTAWGTGDPDEQVVTSAYEKGYLFLRLLEETVGRERWDAFLRGYFDAFAFETMTSARFVAYLREHLVAGDAALEKTLRIDEWVDGTGLPDNTPRVRSAAFEHVQAQAGAWADGRAVGELKTKGWSTQEWKQFIQRLPESESTDRIAELDEAFGFSKGTNGEVLQVWFLHAIDNHYEAAYPYVEKYLLKIGRIWLIRPLYRRLANTPEGREMALDIYREARPGYHPLTVSLIDEIVGWKNN